jgi:hypothetical protein
VHSPAEKGWWEIVPLPKSLWHCRQSNGAAIEKEGACKQKNMVKADRAVTLNLMNVGVIITISATESL